MEENPKRVEEFKAEIADLRVGVPSSAGDRKILVLGIILVAVGIALVLGGWYGASGVGTIAEQFPYLISGGVLGLACVIVGSVLFARYSMTRFLQYWLIRVIYEQQAQTDRLIEAVARSRPLDER
jgi:hypothetical protein